MYNKKLLTEFDTDMMELPRGGYLVNTSEGYIQFGSLPETIKDKMDCSSGSGNGNHNCYNRVAILL